MSEANQSSLSHLVGGLSFFQFSPPTSGNWNNTLRMVMETAYGTGSYVVDAAYLASVPEPATLSLAALGLLVSLLRVAGRRTRRVPLASCQCSSLPGQSIEQGPSRQPAPRTSL